MPSAANIATRFHDSLFWTKQCVCCTVPSPIPLVVKAVHATFNATDESSTGLVNSGGFDVPNAVISPAFPKAGKVASPRKESVRTLTPAVA
jgi:hypothetical protein